MTDEAWRWCGVCRERVDAEIIDGCGHWECPMKCPVVDCGDELHEELGSALKTAEGNSK